MTGVLLCSSVAHVSFLEMSHSEITYTQLHQKELVGSKRAPQSLDDSKTSEIISRIVLSEVRRHLPKKFKSQALRISETIVEEANRYKMDPLFILSIIRQESKMNPVAIGSVGEIGLMQIRPCTAKWLNDKYKIVKTVDLKNPMTNIKIGSFFLSTLRQSFNGQSQYYISAYNMGAAKVRQKLKQKSKPEIYAKHVMKHYLGYMGDLDSVNAVEKVASIK